MIIANIIKLKGVWIRSLQRYIDDLKNLEGTYKKVKDVRIHTKMLAMLMVRTYEMPQNKVTMMLGMTYKSVSKRVRRFDNKEADAL